MPTPELCLGPRPDDRLALVLKHAGTHLSQAQAPDPLGCFEDVSFISQVPRHYCRVISVITISIKTCLAGLESHSGGISRPNIIKQGCFFLFILSLLAIFIVFNLNIWKTF